MQFTSYYETARPFVQHKAPAGLMYRIYTVTIQSLSGNPIDNEFALYADFVPDNIEFRTVKGRPTYQTVIAPYSFQYAGTAFFDLKESPLDTKYITGLFGSETPATTCIVTINYDLVPYNKQLMTKDALIKSGLA